MRSEKKKKKSERKKEKKGRKKASPLLIRGSKTKQGNVRARPSPAQLLAGSRFPAEGSGLLQSRVWNAAGPAGNQAEKNPLSSADGFSLHPPRKPAVFRAEEAVRNKLGAQGCALTAPGRLQRVIPPPHSRPLPPRSVWPGREGTSACPSPLPFKSLYKYPHLLLPNSSRETIPTFRVECARMGEKTWLTHSEGF